MPLDANIILQNRLAAQAQDQQAFANLMNMLDRSAQDSYRQEKLDMERQKAGVDVESLAKAALMKEQMGLPQSPEERAGLYAYDKLQMSKLAFDPVTGQTYQRSTSLMGNGQPPQAMPYEGAPAPQVNEKAGVDVDFLAAMSNPQQPAPVSPSNSPIANTPKGQMETFQTNEEIRASKEKEAAKADAKAQYENTKKSEVAPQFDSAIKEMLDINEQLNKLGGLQNPNAPLAERVGMQARTSLPGRMIAPTVDPKVASLRKRYKDLQDSLYPQYKQAAKLSAQEGNTEAERKANLAVFGDPTGEYESNKNLLNRALVNYGSGKSAPTTGAVRRYNPATGKIE